MAMENFSPGQQKIIKRYYSQQDTIQLQRLAELVTDLYLAEGKKKEKVWASVAGSMEKLGVPKSRIDHVLAQKDPMLVANIVTELQGKK